MRMTRIRYKQHAPNILISTKPILCGAVFTYVMLYTNTMIWCIYRSDDHKILSSGIAPNLTQLKKGAKIGCRNLKATFHDEVYKKLVIK